MRSSSILPKIVKVGSLVGYSCSSQLLLLTVSIPRAPQHNGHKRLFVFSPLGLPGVSSIVPPSSDVLRLLHVTSCRIIFLDPMSPALRPPAFSFLRFYIFTPPGVGLPPVTSWPLRRSPGPLGGNVRPKSLGAAEATCGKCETFSAALGDFGCEILSCEVSYHVPQPSIAYIHIYADQIYLSLILVIRELVLMVLIPHVVHLLLLVVDFMCTRNLSRKSKPNSRK